MLAVYFGSVVGVVVVQRKMVGSRRTCFLVFHLQMKGQVVADEEGTVVVVDESVEVEVVVAAVVDVEVEEEPQEADKAVVEY